MDSSFPGYGPAVLTDGRWYAKGEENPNDYGPSRLGNGGNAWAASETPGEHWICLEWPQPVTLDEVEIWWALAEWYPRAFRVERWQDGRWVPAGAGEGWLAPLDRQSVIALPKTRTQRLRILQSDAGASTRRFMSAQEVLVFDREGKTRATAGTRALSPEAFARLTSGPSLERNIARLNEVCPGAMSAVAWDTKGKEKAIGASGVFGERIPQTGDSRFAPLNPSPALKGTLSPSKGERERERGPSVESRFMGKQAACPALAPGCALGVRWPVRHSIDTVAVVFVNDPPHVRDLVLEADDGQGWVAVTTGLKSQVQLGERRIEWTFEPVVTRAIRVRMTRGGTRAPVAEIAVLRFMPPSKDVWPDRFVQKNGLQQELLAGNREPSFESAALKSHNMQSARAFVGLKDHPSETGVGWEGSLFGRERIQFRFGAEEYALGEYPDTVSRTLIDGWKPGVIVEGRMHNLHVRETVFAVPMGSRLASGRVYTPVGPEPLAAAAERLGGSGALRRARGRGAIEPGHTRARQ